MSDWVLFYVVVSIVAGMASVAIAYYAWEKRHIPGAIFLALMMGAAAVWCGGYLGEILVAPPAENIWARIAYIGALVVSPSWLLFCLTYTGRLSTNVRKVATALAVAPLLGLVFVILSPGPFMVWSSMEAAPPPDPSPVVVEEGVWFWVDVVYSYGCLLTGSVLLLVTVMRQVRFMTSQGLLLVAAISLPWIANTIHVLGLTPAPNLNLTHPVMVLSTALFVVCLVRQGALGTFPGMVPAARNAVVHNMRDGVLVVDVNGRVVDANRAAECMLAKPGLELVGRPLQETFCAPQVISPPCEDLAVLAQCEKTEVSVMDGAGKKHDLEMVVSSLGSRARATGYVIVMREVTDRKALEDELRHRATHDELTGLPNRSFLREHLDQLLRLNRRKRGRLALLVIDLDSFKDVNDTFGHEAGDHLLKVMAQRLRETLRDSDTVARLGGDEFAVVLYDCGAAEAVAIASKLREQFLKPVELQHQSVVVSGSVGVALSPLHGRDYDTLMRHADVALYQAKDGPQDVTIYQAQRDPNSGEKLGLLRDLRTAVQTGSLVLHYQPEISLASGEVVRVEALARWPLSDGTVLEAGDFLPLAEKHGIMPLLTSWALSTALRQRGTWWKAGWSVDVAVNLSAPELRDPGLSGRVDRLLKDLEQEAEHLWLEITETAAMRDPARTQRTLRGLRAFGVRLAIDDFGTGHSSLAYVRTLPASDLKIDRSFVHDADSQPRDAAIVKAAVALAHDLGMTVTAEGVETAETLEYLRSLGCDHAQGYYVARPMPADEMLRWAQGTASRAHLTPSPVAAR